MMVLDGLMKLILIIYLGDNMKDFTQTTDDEKTAMLNKEIAGLREENKALQLALFKERKNNNALKDDDARFNLHLQQTVYHTGSVRMLWEKLGIKSWEEAKKAHLHIPIEELSNGGCTPEGKLIRK